MPKEQKQGYYDSLTHLQKGTYARFYELQKKYEQDKYETAARQSGDLAAERVSRFKIFNGRRPAFERYNERAIGAGLGNSPSEHQRTIPKDDAGIKGTRESFEE